MNFVPKQHQKDAIKAMLQCPHWAVFASPGAGKTSITLAAFRILRNKGLVKSMLVLAPLRPALSVWSGEAAKWFDFQGLKVVVLHGKRKDQLINEPADIYVLNYDGLSWYFENVKQLPEMLVCDELSCLKNSSSKRFKLLKPQLKKFKRRYGLTGTPAPNGLMDLFGQIYVIDEGKALGRFITHYRKEYFDSDYMGWTWTLKPGAEQKIYDKLATVAMRIDVTKCLDLPELIYNTYYVDLPDKARKVYKEVEDEFITQLDNKDVVAVNAAVASMKCRQICNGAVYSGGNDGTERVVHDVHSGKIEALEELVAESQGRPLMVAYEFQSDLAAIQRRFPDAPVLGAGLTRDRQCKIESDWNAGRIPVLLVQPASVAFGLNLQGTPASMAWFSIPWNLEHRIQTIARIWRQGQKERVVVHDIVARGTIDEVVMKVLREKDQTQTSLLNALASYAKVRDT